MYVKVEEISVSYVDRSGAKVQQEGQRSRWVSAVTDE